MIIAIDGPAGSGKSTISKMVAKRVGALYVDTGAMYRALTFKVMNDGIPFDNEQAIADAAGECSIEMIPEGEGNRVLLDGRDVTLEIRTPELTDNVKHVAKLPAVREKMVKLQRETALASGDGAVLEGRDIGTVVFPDADKKFFMTASVAERARRRFEELKSARNDLTMDKIKRDIEKRDASDINREVGPLKAADDAVIIDTTDMSIDQVVSLIMESLN